MKKSLLFLPLILAITTQAMEMKSTAEQTSNRVPYCYMEIDGEQQKEFRSLKLRSYTIPLARQELEQAEQAMEDLRSYFESEFNEQHQCSCNRLCCLRWTCGLMADDPTIEYDVVRKNHYDVNGTRYQLLKPSYSGFTCLLPYCIPHYFCICIGCGLCHEDDEKCNPPYESMPEFGEVFFDYQKVCELAQRAMPYVTLHHPDKIDPLIAQQHSASMTAGQEIMRQSEQQAEVQSQELIQALSPDSKE